MNTELQQAHECAKDCLDLVGLLYSRPGAPDQEAMNQETARIARALIGRVRDAKALSTEVLNRFSVAAGKNYTDHLGEPYRSAHEAAINLARNTFNLIRIAIGPREENPNARFGADEIRQFFELSQDRDRLGFSRNLRAIGYGIEREIASVEPARTEIDPNTFLSHPDLARKYGRDPEKLRKKLERWRPKNRGDWKEIEASERGPRDPQYLYREVAVKPLVDD